MTSYSRAAYPLIASTFHFPSPYFLSARVTVSVKPHFLCTFLKCRAVRGSSSICLCICPAAEWSIAGRLLWRCARISEETLYHEESAGAGDSCHVISDVFSLCMSRGLSSNVSQSVPKDRKFPLIHHLAQALLYLTLPQARSITFTHQILFSSYPFYPSVKISTRVKRQYYLQ